ncbi:competence protein ComJ [Bacillus cytotoxicus]|uniref:competence protein ComJ n=1 Tax=unclassified Bacillus cereus group TaxID=2750818 RepID=UPI001F59BC1E|nr:MULTISPECIES: competence protein ComJ [unclassified Bacillus cereus group]EMA6341362.1 competence protein [Bacillus cytotoxicus]
MELTISYAQFIVMNYDGPPPDIEWTDEAFERGYVQADDAVIFEAISDYTCEVEGYVGQHREREGIVRKVSVPFVVKDEGVFVKSILSNTVHIDVPKGNYMLVLQVIPLEEPTDDELYRVRYELYFEREE